MPVLRRLFVSSVVPALVVSVAVVAACSNSATSPDFTGAPGTGTFCEAESAWATRCGTPAAACDGHLLTDCAAYAPLMNPALLDKARDCLENAGTCSTTPTGCLAGAAVGLTPTTAQALVRSDYCSSCQASGADDCTQVFFGSGGPAAQVGTEVLPFGDRIASAIDACASGASCSTSFVACAETAILAGLATTVGDATQDCLVSAFAASASAGGDDGGAATDSGTGSRDGATNDSGDAASDAGGDAGGGGGDDTCADPHEPDNTADTAATLDQVKDSDDPTSLTASIAIAGEDDDWYTYPGDDAFNTTTAADPFAQVVSKVPMQVCVWAKEKGGDGIGSGCMAGNPTDFPTAGLGYVGCCSTGGTVQMQNYGRTGKDDSSTVLMRVNMMTSANMCVPYTLTYAFKK